MQSGVLRLTSRTSKEVDDRLQTSATNPYWSDNYVPSVAKILLRIATPRPSCNVSCEIK